MREDIWTNTKTKIELGKTGPLGAPGAWLRRAYDVVSVDDHPFLPNTITPHELSVAGVWYRPCQLPDTGNIRTLYRFFDIPSAHDMHRHTRVKEHVPAIGVAICAPAKDVMQYLRQFELAGAAYVFWRMPSNKSIRASANVVPRRQIDHAAIYAELDKGLTNRQIADKLDYPIHNVEYVTKKWRAGQSLSNRAAYCDKAALLADVAAGLTVPELSIKHNKSKAYIYALLKREGHGS